MPVPIDRIFSHVAVEEHVLRSISALMLCDVKSMLAVCENFSPLGA